MGGWVGGRVVGCGGVFWSRQGVRAGEPLPATLPPGSAACSHHRCRGPPGATLSPDPFPPPLVPLNAAAVSVLGASNVVFSNCNFGVNYADAIGGAVKTVGSNVTFASSAFYQNRVSLFVTRGR